MINLSNSVTEAQWATLINKVQDQYLPKILNEKRHEYIEHFIYKVAKESSGKPFIAHYKINGLDKYIACFGKTGCATCGNGGYVSDWRIFSSLQQIYGFISEAELLKTNVISEKEMNELFNLQPTIVEIDESKEKALFVFSGALLVVLLKDLSLLEFNLNFDFNYFFKLHEDKLSHFCDVLKPFNKNPKVLELIEKANSIIELEFNKQQEIELQTKYTKELIAWVNQNISAIETEVKKLVPQLQSKVRNENPKLYPNKQAEIFAAKYIDFCFLEAIDIVWNKQINKPIVWEKTLSASYMSIWCEIQSTFFIQRFSNSQKQKLFSTNVENW